MNRTNKFRGKDLETGKWVYGDLLHPITSCRIVNYTEIEEEGVERAYYHYHDVDPDTRGEFIGLYDSNGKEIYEGDIFTVNGKYPKVVKFISEQAAFCIANIDELNRDYIYPWQRPSSDWWDKFKREIIIIGNIFDNPDLLKGE